MTLKMDSRDDRIGRSVSLGEMLGLSGVMPPTPANQRSGNRKERDDEVLTSAGFAIDWFLGSIAVWRRRFLKLLVC